MKKKWVLCMVLYEVTYSEEDPEDSEVWETIEMSTVMETRDGETADKLALRMNLVD